MLIEIAFLIVQNSLKWYIFCLIFDPKPYHIKEGYLKQSTSKFGEKTWF